jgi:hypothetical protein
MAKAPKYPKKFRQKLERIETGRDARAATGDPNARLPPDEEEMLRDLANRIDSFIENTDALFDNYWRQFLPPKSVETIYKVYDTVLRRETSVNVMNEATVRVLHVLPPWRDGRGSE